LLDKFGNPNEDWSMETMVVTDSPLMTLEQAAPVAGCTPTYLRRLANTGRIETVRMAGGRPLVTERTAKEVRRTLTSRAVCNRQKPKAKPKRKPAARDARRG
jgi:hypothetical protein